jgi:hypothetical protein
VAITAIVVGMGIRITDLTEIQVTTTGIRVTPVTATQAGAVDRSIREKMYLTSRGEYQSSGICLLPCLSGLMSI